MVVAVAAVLGAYALNLSKSSIQYASVTLSGSASTVTPGNTPLNLVFTAAAGDAHNVTVTNNHYSVILPTNRTYFVRLRFEQPNAIIPGVVGDCSVGTITIPTNAGSSNLTKNWSC